MCCVVLSRTDSVGLIRPLVGCCVEVDDPWHTKGGGGRGGGGDGGGICGVDADVVAFLAFGVGMLWCAC
jgi:hypothetical protein